MTKEGALNYLKNFRMIYADLAPERFLEALDHILSQPSLPSDLDEAATKYAKGEYDKKNPATLPDRCKGCYAPLMYAFKAGAEWWAGQGVTKDAVIGMETKDIFINVSGRTLDELNLCPGDKVVVQIRKK